MREIKFRGKRLDNGEWIYGFYRQYPIYKSCGKCVDHINHFIDCECKSEFVDPATVGQYTGLKDKNGKEIYEGDIVICRYGYCGNPIYKTHEDVVAVSYRQDIHNIYSSDIYEFEIIGNIHDNPKLLEPE